MLKFFPILLLPILTLASPLDPSSPFQRSTSNFQWKPCFNNPNIECSVYNAPLDYNDVSAGNATLAVIRYKATQNPKLGTLWTNFGGPGVSGIESIASSYGEFIHNVTGGYYDVASWDPRGVNSSEPQIKCFNSSSDELAFWNQSVITSLGIEENNNFTNPGDLDAFYAQIDPVDNLLQQFGNVCLNASGTALKYVGSTAAVRDMVAMADALDGLGTPINFWGFSYGSVVGEYFVNMFPDRVGRVVIDGIVNAQLWATAPAYNFWDVAVLDAEKALQSFAQSCATVGPDACAISFGKSGSEVYDWIKTFISDAYEGYKYDLPISSAAIRRQLHGGMYSPQTWKNLSTWLYQQSQIIYNTTVASGGASIETTDSSNDPPHDHSFQAISCGDSPDPTYSTRDVFYDIVAVTQHTSSTFGPQLYDLTAYCHRWPVRAVERFTGPFNHTLREPILIVGNEADPITPFRNAKSAAQALGNSAVLVKQEGIGHTSYAMHSDCTIQTVARYLIGGKLPGNGTKLCPVNQPVFSTDNNQVSLITSVSPISPNTLPAKSSSGFSNFVHPASAALSLGSAVIASLL